jgi:hypothetical protein
VSVRLVRTLVALALAPWLVGASMMPREHVHETDEPHSHSVTHRHFEAHDHDGAEIEHGAGRIVWLEDGLALVHVPYQLTVPGMVVPAHFEACPDPKSWVVESILDGSPPHGPPRRYTSLRAPPSLSA